MNQRKARPDDTRGLPAPRAAAALVPLAAAVVVSLAAAVLALLAGAPCARAQNPFLDPPIAEHIVRIELEGNRRTHDYVLLREMGIAPGDPYDPNILENAWERLEALDFIAYVDIQEERPRPGEVVLLIQVEEDNRFGWTPYLTYERRFGVFGGLALRWVDLRGRAEEARFETSWGEVTAYHVGWQNPWVLGKAHLGVGLDAFWQRFDFDFHPFRLTDRSLRASVWRDLPGWLRATAFGEVRGLGIAESSYAPAPDGTNADHAVGIVVEHDSRDLRYYPSLGIHALASVRWAGFGKSVADYNLYDAVAAGFVPLPRLGILGGRVAWHGVSHPVPVYERQFLGGPMNLRGIDFGSIRGDKSWLATLELRHPLFLVPLREGRAVGLGLHAFHDWGKAWEAAASFDDAPLRRSWGAGVHLNLNTRNLRFEWAHTDDGDNVFVFEDRFTF